MLERINDRLQRAGFASEVVSDRRGTPVATHVRDALAGPVLDRVAQTILRVDSKSERHLPQGCEQAIESGSVAVGRNSGAFFGWDIGVIADFAVQVATTRLDVLATNLTMKDDGHLAGDGPMHVDCPLDILDDVEESVLGLNIWAGISSVAVAELGLIEDFDFLRSVATAIKRRGAGGRLSTPQLDVEFGKLYARTLKSFGRVVLRGGDVLIFQGQARPELGDRYPAAHIFITPDGVPYPRHYALMNPSFGTADEVIRQRAAHNGHFV